MNKSEEIIIWRPEYIDQLAKAFGITKEEVFDVLVGAKGFEESRMSEKGHIGIINGFQGENHIEVYKRGWLACYCWMKSQQQPIEPPKAGLTINAQFQIGQTVFLKTDKDQLERVVSCISIGPNGFIEYQLRCGITQSWHFGFEINEDKDVLQTL